MKHRVSMRTPSVRRYLALMAEHGPATDTQMSKRLGVARAMANTARRFLQAKGRVVCIGMGPQPEHGRPAQLWELVA
jgi:predicted ArsR family transcriptional regulator